MIKVIHCTVWVITMIIDKASDVSKRGVGGGGGQRKFGLTFLVEQIDMCSSLNMRAWR